MGGAESRLTLAEAMQLHQDRIKAARGRLLELRDAVEHQQAHLDACKEAFHRFKGAIVKAREGATQ